MLTENAIMILEELHKGPENGWKAIGEASVFANLKDEPPHGIQCSAYVLTDNTNLYLFLYREQEGMEFFTYLYTPYYLGPGTYKGPADDVAVFAGWTQEGSLENWKAVAESYTELTTYFTQSSYWLGAFNCKALKSWNSFAQDAAPLPELEIQFAFFDQSAGIGEAEK